MIRLKGSFFFFFFRREFCSIKFLDRTKTKQNRTGTSLTAKNWPNLEALEIKIYQIQMKMVGGLINAENSFQESG